MDSAFHVSGVDVIKTRMFAWYQSPQLQRKSKHFFIFFSLETKNECKRVFTCDTTTTEQN